MFGGLFAKFAKGIEGPYSEYVQGTSEGYILRATSLLSHDIGGGSKNPSWEIFAWAPMGFRGKWWGGGGLCWQHPKP